MYRGARSRNGCWLFGDIGQVSIAWRAANDLAETAHASWARSERSQRDCDQALGQSRQLDILQTKSPRASNRSAAAAVEAGGGDAC